jgi:hypothetical protein
MSNLREVKKKMAGPDRGLAHPRWRIGERWHDLYSDGSCKGHAGPAGIGSSVQLDRYHLYSIVHHHSNHNSQPVPPL